MKNPTVRNVYLILADRCFRRLWCTLSILFVYFCGKVVYTYVWCSSELCHACNVAYSLAADLSVHELDLELTASSSGHNILTLKNVKRRYSPGF